MKIIIIFLDFFFIFSLFGPVSLITRRCLSSCLKISYISKTVRDTASVLFYLTMLFSKMFISRDMGLIGIWHLTISTWHSAPVYIKIQPGSVNTLLDQSSVYIAHGILSGYVIFDTHPVYIFHCGNFVPALNYASL